MIIWTFENFFSLKKTFDGKKKHNFTWSVIILQMGNGASDELLFNATKIGDLEKVKELLSKGARTEFRDEKVR